MSKCENCKDPHAGEFGSGRFCSKACARSFSTKANRKEISTKVSKLLKGRPVSDERRAQIKRCITPASIEKQRKSLKQFYSKRSQNKAWLETRLQSLLLATCRIKGQTAKKLLLALKLKKDKCERCGMKPLWQNIHLVLQLHHKDGNRGNNTLENLEIVCPNCHSQSDSFRGKNIGKTGY